MATTLFHTDDAELLDAEQETFQPIRKGQGRLTDEQLTRRQRDRRPTARQIGRGEGPGRGRNRESVRM